ncbi:MAG: HAD family phosphatase [Rothia sp. (in: high G+C Gram-positive bacteria)]|uniref:HAD family hydrolase n=1 Tax=Rothia sp. (in: high G+C Gram-positive bacteria) TaxID=1885016 RepID=UPI0026DFCCAB|nr:HAD family phosphatase [Rothia sp. (in: high G+C Gram-positive bacteria)]MDO5749798.1 HAD family phosphatase [Rothia sp. (in: high G+C Gram-positive bacteria)]
MLNHDLPESWVPTCAVFDCDGVLLDSETAWNSVQRELFEKWNIPFSLELEERLTGLSAPQVADVLADLSYTGDRANTEAFIAHRDATLHELMTVEHEVISSGVQMIEGAYEFMAFLAQFMPVAVASNSTAGILKLKMDTYGHAKLVQTWVSSDDVPAGKPAPDMYLEAVRRLGGDPAFTITFEDSAAGAQAARDAGTKLLVFAPEGASESTPAGHGVFTSFTDPDLLALAQRWAQASAS